MSRGKDDDDKWQQQWSVHCWGSIPHETTRLHKIGLSILEGHNGDVHEVHLVKTLADYYKWTFPFLDQKQNEQT